MFSEERISEDKLWESCSTDSEIRWDAMIQLFPDTVFVYSEFRIAVELQINSLFIFPVGIFWLLQNDVLLVQKRGKWPKYKIKTSDSKSELRLSDYEQSL